MRRRLVVGGINKMSKYDNGVKNTARGWIWNRVCERFKTNDEKRRARVYTLIGDTTKELEVAQAKGFSKFNIIGVDIRPEPVEAWRSAGGIAIQAPIEVVVGLSKYPPNVVIADFCGGLTDKTFRAFQIALIRTVWPGCVVTNLLRGRDDIQKYGPFCLTTDVGEVTEQVRESYKMIRESSYGDVVKKRSVVLFYDIFKRLYADVILQSANMPMDRRPTASEMKNLSDTFDYYYKRLKDQMNPNFYDYKSSDSNQYFDSLVINAMGRLEDKSDKEKELAKAFLDQAIEFSPDDLLLYRRRLAAMEAVRTMKLRELKEHYRERYV